MFASFTIVNLLFVVTFVVETKGKTLQEISEHFGAPSGGNHIPERTIEPSYVIESTTPAQPTVIVRRPSRRSDNLYQ